MDEQIGEMSEPVIMGRVTPPDVLQDEVHPIGVLHRGSLSIVEMAKALITFQKNCPTLDRNANGVYNNKYTTLDHLIAKTRDAMEKAGLSMTFGIEDAERGVTVTALLMHESGAYLSSSLYFEAGPGPQKVGAAITYARRYLFCALLNIQGEDDDDAQSLQDDITPRPQAPRRGRPPGAKNKPPQGKAMPVNSPLGAFVTKVNNAAKAKKITGEQQITLMKDARNTENFSAMEERLESYIAENERANTGGVQNEPADNEEPFDLG
jgi:hypothetical protein